MNAPFNYYIHVIVKQDTYLMGLLKCGLNSNKTFDLSMDIKRIGFDPPSATKIGGRAAGGPSGVEGSGGQQKPSYDFSWESFNSLQRSFGADLDAAVASDASVIIKRDFILVMRNRFRRAVFPAFTAQFA